MNDSLTLGVFGATPRFTRPIANGQRFFPSWVDYEEMFRDIFKRQYYTNQGPLAQALEKRLAEKLCVRNAICMSNEFIGLVSATDALRVEGPVVVPALTSLVTLHSLEWTQAKPLVCDVDAATGTMVAEDVERLLARQSATAILGVNPWGDACDVLRLQDLADRFAIPLYFDSSQGFGCAIAGKPVGSFGKAEVISFQSANVLGACEGAVVCTQDDELAAYIRNTRSSYGMGKPVPVPKTSNGRMSEAQAAIALFSLDHYPEYRQRNEAIFQIVREGLARIPGIRIRVPVCVSDSNYQNLICLVDEDVFGLNRNHLWEILRGENLMVSKGFVVPRSRAENESSGSDATDLPHAEKYSASTIDVPMNFALTNADADWLVDFLRYVQANSGRIRHALAKRP